MRSGCRLSTKRIKNAIPENAKDADIAATLPVKFDKEALRATLTRNIAPPLRPAKFPETVLFDMDA